MLDKKKLSDFRRAMERLPGVDPKTARKWAAQIVRAMKAIGSTPTVAGTRRAVRILGSDQSTDFMRRASGIALAMSAELAAMVDEREAKARRDYEKWCKKHRPMLALKAR